MTDEPGAIPRTALDAYVDALLSGDRVAALQTVAALREQGFDVARIVTELIAPAQRSIGSAWQTTSISVAAEHQATAITETVVARLMADRAAPAVPGRCVTLFSAEGEQHSLAAKMAALVWEQEGWDVRLVAPSIPPAEVAAFVSATGTSLAGVSCALPSNLFGAWRVIDALREQGCWIVVGGRGIEESGGHALAHQLGADAYGANAEQAAAALRTLAHRGPPEARAGVLQGPRAGEAEALRAGADRIVPDVVDMVVAQASWPHVTAQTRAELAQGVSMLLDSLTATVLVHRLPILSAHLDWYRERLMASGTDPVVVDLVLAALQQRVGIHAAAAGAHLAAARRV